jgi:sterol desaturase/sphingolipid hydroxylase (fatty acid hydroxylase superfamily)
MISFSSIKNFIIMNSIMITTSLFHYAFTSPSEENDFGSDLLIQFALSLTTNYLFLDLIESRNINKDKIMSEKRTTPKERFYKEFDLYVCSTTMVDSITQVIVKKYFLTDYNTKIILSDFINFLHVSFSYEIIFDFFHYCSHYYLHKNPYMYKNFHKTHHTWTYPISILTFYMHPIDYILTNSIPTFLTLYIFPFHISSFQYELMHQYKTLLEISGHSGRIIKSNSFIQFIWLPRFFNIHMKVEDHDLHHTLNNCNYSKRFILWDKVFGTNK